MQIFNPIIVFIFDFLTKLFNLYTGVFIFSCVLGLWVLRKIVDLIRQIF